MSSQEGPKAATIFDQQIMNIYRGRGRRKVARPKTRWVDDVAKFASIHGLGNWINVAFDEARWMDLECEFVKDEWRYDAETRTTMI